MSTIASPTAALSNSQSWSKIADSGSQGIMPLKTTKFLSKGAGKWILRPARPSAALLAWAGSTQNRSIFEQLNTVRNELFGSVISWFGILLISQRTPSLELRNTLLDNMLAFVSSSRCVHRVGYRSPPLDPAARGPSTRSSPRFRREANRWQGRRLHSCSRDQSPPPP